MLAETGSILTGLALAATLYAAFAVLWSVRSDDRRWYESGRNGVFAAATLLGASVVALLAAFLSDQFSIEYVAQHSSRALPLYLKASAVWGGQAGSLLLWASLQALFAALVVGRPSGRMRPLVPWATVILSLITGFFAFVTLALSNPFDTSLAVPTDGQGLNPLLRHPGMIFHPPALYVGYVGLAVPFALGLAALISGRVEEWPGAARRWTLTAWLCLGLGLLLGMRWAYDVLGWGGYWGWDPVENAGLMPWLAATGLLHALVMQDQRRGFRWWTMVLALLSFVLVLFGTFTTRSGLIQSVHAFARSNLGPYFLAAMGLTLGGSLLLFFSRRELLAGQGEAGDLLSREGMFTLTLVLLLTITGSVFIGSVLPTLSEALTDQRLEAGPSWFDRVVGPQLGALILIMGVCPLLGSTVGALRRLRRRGLAAIIGGAAVAIAGVLAGFTRPVSVVGLGLIGLAGGTTVAGIARGVQGRRRQGASAIRALWGVFSGNRRRYAGYLVHLGVVLMALGVIGTRFYPFETEVMLEAGQSAEVEGYSLALGDIRREPDSDRVRTVAPLTVSWDGKVVSSLSPTLDQYSNFQQTVATPAIRAGLREDLYVVLAGWSDGGARVTLKVFINPLASFLWIGGLVFLAGGAVALWPAAEAVRLPAPQARRRRVWSTVGVVVGLVVLALAVWAMWGGAQGRAASVARSGQPRLPLGSQAGNRPRVGGLAPALALSLLDGSPLNLSELRGQVTVLNFWSPQCQPCEDEIPDLQAIWEEYQERGVAVLGIGFPEEESAVREMISDLNVTYPNALHSTAAAEYGITGVPETFVVGPEGDVAFVHIGPIRPERLRQQLDSLLAE
ncbi:MAG: cytochrome c-type biogenesis CcmF C-terminal domain-containing protein [Anaerolineae bacterium]|jgi:cytochrome c-type biogenesis protein CcmF